MERVFAAVSEGGMNAVIARNAFRMRLFLKLRHAGIAGMPMVAWTLPRISGVAPSTGST